MEMNERNLEINEIPVSTIDHSSIEIKKPKRLYFSDGVVEEFSEEENDEIDNEIVESELEWGPWIIHKSLKTGSNVLAACDYVGGKLASALGITTPKFGSEIEDYKKRQEAEKADLEKAKEEYSSWQGPNNLAAPITIQEKEQNIVQKF